MKNNVLVAGLFGGGNFGDELFSRIILQELYQKRFKEISLYTLNPNLSERNTDNAFKPVEFLNFSTKSLKNILGLRQMDFILVGGGGLFNQVFSTNAVLNYIILLLIASVFGCKFGLHGIEVGYIKSNYIKKLIIYVFNKAEFVVVRDSKSFEKLKIWGVTNLKLGTDLSHDYLHNYFKVKDQNKTQMLVVNIQHALLKYPLQLESLIQKYLRNDYKVIFLVTSKLDYEKVERFINESSLTVYKNSITLTFSHLLDDNLKILSEADAFITEKYHFTLAGYHSLKQLHVIPMTTKVKEFLNEVNADLETNKEHPFHYFENASSLINSERQKNSCFLADLTRKHFDDLPFLIHKKKSFKPSSTLISSFFLMLLPLIVILNKINIYKKNSLPKDNL